MINGSGPGYVDKGKVPLAAWLVCVFLVALVVRSGFLLWRGPGIYPDTFDYLTLARNTVNHGIYSCTSPGG